jgi:hypothetical protein
VTTPPETVHTLGVVETAAKTVPSLVVVKVGVKLPPTDWPSLGGLLIETEAVPRPVTVKLWSVPEALL